MHKDNHLNPDQFAAPQKNQVSAGEPLIMVEGVSKKFCRDTKRSQWYGLIDSYGKGGSNHHLRPNEFWSVSDVSLNVRRGECLGLMGHNGAGKSTLLKMLTGLIRPNTGHIKMKGRVSALIELGTGFNPILTGRENIYNNGAILGLSKRDVDLKLEGIVHFSGLSEFIDTPVQYYSSGMKIRLGFSVATQMDADILLIDEVLSVGDMNFVLKCFNRMDELMPKTAVILVSHSIPNIARASTKIGIMDKGRIIHLDNDVSAGLSKYYELFQPSTTSFQSGAEATLVTASISDGNTSVLPEDGFAQITHDAPFVINFEIKANIDLNSCSCYIAFYDISQRNFAEVLNGADKQPYINMTSGESNIYTAKFNGNAFAQGVYSVTLAFYAYINGIRRMIFRANSLCPFRVYAPRHGWAPICLNPEWIVGPGK